MKSYLTAFYVLVRAYFYCRRRGMDWERYVQLFERIVIKRAIDEVAARFSLLKGLP